MIPNMPHIAFWLLAGLIGGLGYYYQKQRGQQNQQLDTVMPSVVAPEMEEVSWKDLSPVKTLGLEVGYRLITLVDEQQGGELLRRIKGVRRKFAQEVGFLPPAVHINDNLELKPSGYRINLKGVEIGSGESHPGQFMAINPGMVSGDLPGAKVNDPAFGLPAVWIDAGLRDQAQIMGYTVVDASTVVATHINHLMSSHAADLLGRQELQALLDHIAVDSPKLIEDLIPKAIPLITLQKILQNLLFEDIHIRDMHTIIEAILEYAGQTQDAGLLTSMVRIALSRAIVQQIIPGENELPVMTLDNRLEQLLMQTIQTQTGDVSSIEPSLAETLAMQTAQATQQQENMGYVPVLLVPAPLRTLLSRFLRRNLPQLKVLSHAELPDSYTIKVTNLVGA